MFYMRLFKLIIGALLIFFFGMIVTNGFQIFFNLDFRAVILPEMDVNDARWSSYGAWYLIIGSLGVLFGVFLVRKTIKDY